MDNKQRLEILREIQRRAKEGDLDTADFISEKLGPVKRATSARDLMEESLSDLVLQDTKYKIPGKGSTKADVTSFLEKVLSEQYPEINPDITIKQQLESLGLYDPSNKKIELLADEVKKSPQKALATTFHEGAHQFDDVKFPGNSVATKELIENRPELTEKIKRMGLSLDPTEAYEVLGKEHHLPLSSRSGNTFGLGGLKSYLKSGKFKSVMPGAIGTGVAAAMAGSASDALADVVVPGGVEGVGEGSDSISSQQDRDMDLIRASKEDQTLNTSRLKALQRMLGK
jgi:hypothetical protein